MLEKTFLIELGTEELPAKILKKLGKNFFNNIINELENFCINCSKVDWFISSCHLAVKARIQIDIQNLIKNFDRISKRYEFVAFLDQKYFKNIEKEKYDNFFIKNEKNNNNFKNKVVYNDKIFLKKRYLYFLLEKVVENSLKKLTGYKTMRWGKENFFFIRPVHSVVMLLDQEVVPGYFFNIKTGRTIYGHKYMGKKKIILNHADQYPDFLSKKGKVIVDYKVRKEIICLGVSKEAKKIGGVVNFHNNFLLEEVTALTEWPIILLGKFNKKFLKIPNEIILHIIQNDQKHFPVYSISNNLLMPYFIFVVNIVVDDYKDIISGYESVIASKLMDAEFFLENDNKMKLIDYLPKLDFVLFHDKLGTLKDKIKRVEKLSSWIAENIGEDVVQIKRAARLSKCDLMSNVVFEFPFTQGIMGMYYALRDGETEQIAISQKEQYQPKCFDDKVPNTVFSCIISIADKMDTISGIFGIQEYPKGNRDPFALKRAALGILRMLIQKEISLNFYSLIRKSVYFYSDRLKNLESIIDYVIHFMNQRLLMWYLKQGYNINIIKAIFNVKPEVLFDFDIRLKSINMFVQMKEKFHIFLLIYKRVFKIFLQQKIDITSIKDYHREFFIKHEEHKLCNALISVKNSFFSFYDKQDYFHALLILTELFEPINIFFSNVVIMEKNKIHYMNRLALLKDIYILFSKIADFSLFSYKVSKI